MALIAGIHSLDIDVFMEIISCTESRPQAVDAVNPYFVRDRGTSRTGGRGSAM